MARLRLQYDEARKRRIDLQKKLAQIHDNEPQTCANNSDRDRYVQTSLNSSYSAMDNTSLLDKTDSQNNSCTAALMVASIGSERLDSLSLKLILLQCLVPVTHWIMFKVIKCPGVVWSWFNNLVKKKNKYHP